LSDAITLHWLATGNHDLKPLKTSGFSHEQHLDTTAEAVSVFVRDH